jgi:hypothetical protein
MPQGAIPISEQKVEGSNNKLAMTAATVVKATPGRIDTVITTNSSTATTFTVSLYDAATTASTASTNLIATYTVAAAASGSTNTSIDFPFLTGLVIVPSSTAVSVAASFN